MGEKYEALTTRLKQIRNLNRAGAVLRWDMETQMPPGGASARGDQLATLSRVAHEMFIADETGQLLEDAEAELNGSNYDSDEASMMRIVREDFDEAVRQPSDFVEAFTELRSRAHVAWKQAREESNFSTFEPLLTEVVDMSRQLAEYLGYEETAYDALLGQYERGMTTAQVADIFAHHKPALIDLIAEVSEVDERVDDTVLRQAFPVEKQKAFGEMVAAAYGYSFDRGRLDISVHPFSISFSKNDARITTRYDDNWLNPALFGTMHEAGHAMYEQGIGENLEGNMLGTGTSLGVHESQSRMWENLVGRSKNFWTWALPKLKETFPAEFGDVDLDTFYKAINKVTKQFIRVEADEATYNLHVMLRFEIEQAMLSGDIAIKDVPAVWNTKFEESFGIVPPNDTRGCLQDIHWAHGYIGYFATYALGNLLSVQYYNKAVEERPSIPDDIANGKFDTLLTWLNENIHQHGRKFTGNELTQRVTGEGIQSDDYIKYLQTKFRDVYGLA